MAYAVVEMLRRRSAGTFDLPEGTLYPALHSAGGLRLVTSRWTEESGRRRRVYQLTAKGPGAGQAADGMASLRACGRCVVEGNGMSGTAVEKYLADLGRELRKRGVFATRFMEETRGHLTDAIESRSARRPRAGRRRGSGDRSFGDPREVAEKFAAHKYRTLHWVLLIAAVTLRSSRFAWVDSRPQLGTNTGITAGCPAAERWSAGTDRAAAPVAVGAGVGHLDSGCNMILRAPALANVLGGFVIVAIPMARRLTAGMAVRRFHRTRLEGTNARPARCNAFLPVTACG